MGQDELTAAALTIVATQMVHLFLTWPARLSWSMRGSIIIPQAPTRLNRASETGCTCRHQPGSDQHANPSSCNVISPRMHCCHRNILKDSTWKHQSAEASPRCSSFAQACSFWCGDMIPPRKCMSPSWLPLDRMMDLLISGGYSAGCQGAQIGA